ncbi:hypothetical protein HIM_09805 [Hirsutella minnesotensis 3608]|uniref:Uncharacterized protein n=1 Tax=Hirsutella minnesotensis 3608 TaxID=1043627 RepID=A0A0F7ZXI7_9HYPO|nr:hypothetical protein HIM_09805 [Hirsutella minnesotensis 3608]
MTGVQKRMAHLKWAKGRLASYTIRVIARLAPSEKPIRPSNGPSEHTKCRRSSSSAPFCMVRYLGY